MRSPEGHSKLEGVQLVTVTFPALQPRGRRVPLVGPGPVFSCDMCFNVDTLKVAGDRQRRFRQHKQGFLSLSGSALKRELAGRRALRLSAALEQSGWIE